MMLPISFRFDALPLSLRLRGNHRVQHPSSARQGGPLDFVRPYCSPGPGWVRGSGSSGQWARSDPGLRAGRCGSQACCRASRHARHQHPRHPIQRPRALARGRSGL